MPRCIECTELWDIYTTLSLKYREALAAARQRSNDLERMRDASELAGRTLREHELTHGMKGPVTETAAAGERSDCDAKGPTTGPPRRCTVLTANQRPRQSCVDLLVAALIRIPRCL